MRSKFRGFYRPNNEDFQRIWKNCRFVFDANVLLNIYRYPIEAREDLFGVLEAIKDRMWVPYQAALEYQRNRISVISEQKKRFRDVREIVVRIPDDAESSFNQMQIINRHALIDPKEFIVGVNREVKKYIRYLDNLETKQLDVHHHDGLRDRIDSLFSDRIGEVFGNDDIKDICEEGKERYLSQTPPGFADADKKGGFESAYSYGGRNYDASYGDLIIWKEILNYCKKENISSLIFITDDEKQDWWWYSSSSGGKKIGPRPELVEEIFQESGVDEYWMYNSEQFVKYAKEFLKVKVREESIDQIREIAIRKAVESEREIAKVGNEATLAVFNWLKDRFYKKPILKSDSNLADFFVKVNFDKEIYISVIYSEKLFIFMNMYKKYINAAINFLVGIPEAKLEVVLVFGGELKPKAILDKFASGELQILSEVNITIGTIGEKDGVSPYFVPYPQGIYRSSGSRDW